MVNKRSSKWKQFRWESVARHSGVQPKAGCSSFCRPEGRGASAEGCCRGCEYASVGSSVEQLIPRFGSNSWVQILIPESELKSCVSVMQSVLLRHFQFSFFYEGKNQLQNAVPASKLFFGQVQRCPEHQTRPIKNHRVHIKNLSRTEMGICTPNFHQKCFLYAENPSLCDSHEGWQNTWVSPWTSTMFAMRKSSPYAMRGRLLFLGDRIAIVPLILFQKVSIPLPIRVPLYRGDKGRLLEAASWKCD